MLVSPLTAFTPFNAFCYFNLDKTLIALAGHVKESQKGNENISQQRLPPNAILQHDKQDIEGYLRVTLKALYE